MGMERRESQQEKKCLIGTTVHEKIYTWRVEHSGDFMTGKTTGKNKPNYEEQRKQNNRQ